jgi:hypothetical protein
MLRPPENGTDRSKTCEPAPIFRTPRVGHVSKACRSYYGMTRSCRDRPVSRPDKAGRCSSRARPARGPAADSGLDPAGHERGTSTRLDHLRQDRARERSRARALAPDNQVTSPAGASGHLRTNAALRARQVPNASVRGHSLGPVTQTAGELRCRRAHFDDRVCRNVRTTGRNDDLVR